MPIGQEVHHESFPSGLSSYVIEFSASSCQTISIFLIRLAVELTICRLRSARG